MIKMYKFQIDNLTLYISILCIIYDVELNSLIVLYFSDCMFIFKFYS